jgi:sulfide:quinone oxidoreductase
MGIIFSMVGCGGPQSGQTIKGSAVMGDESGRISVSGQIQLADLALLKARGIEVIVNNRPDGEAPDQPSHDEVANAAQELGLRYHFIPVSPRGFTEENVAAMQEVLREEDGAIFAYCRSGNRSSILIQAAAQAAP